jgi:hypothetical protein
MHVDSLFLNQHARRKKTYNFNNKTQWVIGFYWGLYLLIDRSLVRIQSWEPLKNEKPALVVGFLFLIPKMYPTE